MKYEEQIKKLCDAIELIREVQNSGLWNQLQNAKSQLHKVVEIVEKAKQGRG